MNDLEQSPNQIPRSGFLHAAPTALAIFPIGVLFGLLASRAQWSVGEVFLLSVLGFSGSGQFALLPLAEQGVGFFTMWVVAASINSRYIPMAFIASPRLPAKTPGRIFLAHLLGDEAYALEQENDLVRRMAAIRITIFGAWVLSNVLGVLIAGSIPEGTLSANLQLGFPASLVLMILSFEQLKTRVPRIDATVARKTFEIVLCIAVALLFFHWLGKVWFWLPSLAFSCWRLWKAGA
ncbi:AzlC family ABC transporter permease [Hydrogenophaga sp. RWCD_12]|uniref:AzlC family ABC transporter permease n=1 Tax=Hydrogenophaga sp. RWCD_12 TaxID=3391190 RepID=UPI003985534F